MERSEATGADVTKAALVKGSALAPAEKWAANSFMITFSFRCNIACTFCMVEDALDRYEGTTLDSFRRFVESRPKPLERAKRIIFSGGEVTLSKELPAYVALARSIPGVEHVRLQTNAVRLANRDYLRSLLDLGVDEFFVSLHGPDAATVDAITQQRGTFDRIVEGMRAIGEAGATLITNTAIVDANYDKLAAIVELAAPFGPRSMEFWNYWPRADEVHGRAHVARVTDVREPLLAALRACVARDIPPVVKWFPRCLLGDLAWCQDDDQPPALIEDRYWEREPDYACIFSGVCLDAHAKPCSGLSHVYLDRYGWEQELLMPRRAPGDRESLARRHVTTRSLVGDAGPKRTEQAAVAAWLAKLALPIGAALFGWRLAEARPRSESDGPVMVLSFVQDGRTVELRVQPTSPARRCFARTRSFDLGYGSVAPDLQKLAGALTRALYAHLAPRDPGGLALPI